MSPERKILIADDDASIRLVLSQAFSRLGYQVRATGNATTLLKWVSDGEGDLVVTDVVMPGASGQEVAEQARARFPGVRVLFMSGYTDDAISHHGVLDDGVEFIHKPFDPETLARRVAEVIRSGRDALEG